MARAEAAKRAAEEARWRAVEAQRARNHHSFWGGFVRVVNAIAPAVTTIALATSFVPGLDAVSPALALTVDTTVAVTNAWTPGCSRSTATRRRPVPPC